MCAPNPAGGSVGSFSKKPLPLAPWSEFFFSSKATSICRQMRDGGLRRGAHGFKNSFYTLHPGFKMVTVWRGHFSSVGDWLRSGKEQKYAE